MLASVNQEKDQPKNEFVEKMKQLNRALGGPAGDIKAVQKAQAEYKEKKSGQSLATKIF